MTIKDARKPTGWTQQSLSDEPHIPKRTIDDREGERRNCPERVERLIVQEILRRTGKEEQTTKPPTGSCWN